MRVYLEQTLLAPRLHDENSTLPSLSHTGQHPHDGEMLSSIYYMFSLSAVRTSAIAPSSSSTLNFTVDERMDRG